MPTINDAHVKSLTTIIPVSSPVAADGFDAGLKLGYESGLAISRACALENRRPIGDTLKIDEVTAESLGEQWQTTHSDANELRFFRFTVDTVSTTEALRG